MAGEPYRPSNGTEGVLFDDDWCAHCSRDAAWRDDPDRNEGCPILSATFIYKITDPEYPKEWVYGADGEPKCTAFTTDPTKPVRCDKTADLFGAHEGNKTVDTNNTHSVRTLPCFKCGKELKPVMSDGYNNQPYDGVTFSTHGQYGSTVFDEFDGAKLEINICDPCLVKGRSNVLHQDGVPRRKWVPWKPDIDSERLASLGE